MGSSSTAGTCRCWRSPVRCCCSCVRCWQRRRWRGVSKWRTTSVTRGTESTKRCTPCCCWPSYSDTRLPTTSTSSGRETSTPSTLSCTTCAFYSSTSSKSDSDRKSSWSVEWYSLLRCLVFSSFHYFFPNFLVPCGRLTWLKVRFSTHVNTVLAYRSVSHLSCSAQLTYKFYNSVRKF